MEQENIQEQEFALETEGYKPRPRYQLVMAWIGVAIMAVGFVLYCWQIAFGAP